MVNVCAVKCDKLEWYDTDRECYSWDII